MQHVDAFSTLPQVPDNVLEAIRQFRVALISIVQMRAPVGEQRLAEWILVGFAARQHYMEIEATHRGRGGGIPAETRRLHRGQRGRPSSECIPEKEIHLPGFVAPDAETRQVIPQHEHIVSEAHGKTRKPVDDHRCLNEVCRRMLCKMLSD
jgi:hypothetical protein